MALRRFSRVSVAAAAALLVPASASAQSASLAFAKTEAILGAPSALEAILSTQKAATPAALVPATFSRPAPDDGARSGRPDLFGSVALQVSHTPLDAKWRALEHAPLRGTPARFAAGLKSLTPTEQLRLVNRYVNARVQYEDDQRRFGRADVWSSADATLRSGRGDCEDYAIAKLQLLRAAGFPQRDLYLTIVRDLVRRADHALLVARAGGHMYVLDSGTDALLDSREVSDYRPVLTFASYGEWTHGYRVAAPIVPAADDQRSRSASLLALSTGFKR
jgi:predicted transglutaminase-like cysteine proteinase